MQKIITSLPIYPGLKPTLSHVVSPYLGGLLEKETGYDQTIAVNLLGEKVKQFNEDELEGIANNYTGKLSNFGINENYTWIDRKEFESIKEILHILLQKGKVYIKEKNVLRCSCGTVEMLEGYGNHGNKKKLLNNGTCDKCNTEAISQKIEGLFFKIPQLEKGTILPIRYLSFINDYIANFTESEILISRQRDTGFQINIEGRDFFVDVDFLRSTWISSLYSKGMKSEITISNPSSLYNTYIGLCIFYSLFGKSSDVVVHPYIQINNNQNPEMTKQGLKHNDFDLDKIINNKELYQMFIGNGFKRDGVDATKIDIGLLKTIQKKIITGEITSHDSPINTDLQLVLKKLHGSNVVNALNGRIGNTKLNPQEVAQILGTYIM